MAKLYDYQCLSIGVDDFIVRWMPANGICLQYIRVLAPVQDLVVCPLSQAIYTIDDFGELAMYDLWNEQNRRNGK